MEPVNYAVFCCAFSPDRLIINIVGGYCAAVVLECLFNKLFVEGFFFVPFNLDIILVIEFGLAFVGAYPAFKNIARALRLAYMVNRLVFGVYCIDAVSAAAEVEVYRIIVTVIVNPEYG